MFYEKVNHACDNNKNINDRNIYAAMARMSDYDKCPGRNFGGGLQFTNWILDSGATCHMMPAVSDYISGSLYDIHIQI